MDGFQGIDLIHQKDGLVTRIAPIQYGERQQHAGRLAKQLRSEGNNETEAYAAVKACNMVAYRPMLSDEEITAIIQPIFAKPLTFSGLDRNRRVWELMKDFRKRGLAEDEIFRRIQLFNSRCCNPPLEGETITWIMENNAYMAENRSFFQVDRNTSQDEKTFIRLGETVEYGGRG